MAWTQNDLDKLKAAIALGVLTVTMNGKTVTYRSLRDMNAIRRDMENELGARPAVTRRVQIVADQGL